MSEQAVIIDFTYGSRDLSKLFELEDRLVSAISDAGVGEYDVNQVSTDGSDATLYMYGPDADRLFEVVRPILEATSFMRGAKARKRYGPPKDGIRETQITIASQFDRG
jgi:hypothetical protein